MSKMRFVFLLFLILSILTGYIPAAVAVDVRGQLTTELIYNNPKEGYPSGLSENGYTTLELIMSGFFQDYQYNLNLKGDSTYFKIDLERMTLTCRAGAGVLEAGRNNWLWGRGFSYSPTYPLNREESYLGFEWSGVLEDHNLAAGTVMRDKDDAGAWLRMGSLLSNSDYTLVLSYFQNGSGNFGLGYSRDFLNGLTAYGEANYSYPGNNQGGFNYLLGGEYLFDKSVLVVEHYNNGKNYLVLNINNSNLFSDWEWQFREVIDLDEEGRRETVKLGYIYDEHLIPSVKYTSYNGSFEHLPRKWDIAFQIKVKF